MAKAPQDFSRYQGWMLIGGCAAYVTGLMTVALLMVGWTSVEEKRGRSEQARRAEPKPPNELARVQEVVIEQIPANPGQSRQQIAQLVAKIQADEAQDPDGFVKRLIRERPDLQGMPFQMGHACRMNGAVSSAFGNAVNLTRDVMRAEDTAIVGPVEPASRFFEEYGGQDTGAGVAALTQIFGPEKQKRREGLAKQLASIDHPASTRALARAAVFDFDKDVREAAVQGLKHRTKQEYTDVLVAALSHPWPVAAQNAASAIRRLHRDDLVPQMVAFLAAPDPRDPFEKEVDGKPATVVREMVKVNHHRNCLLCHSPAPANSMPSGFVGVVPTPGMSFPAPDSGAPYSGSPGTPWCERT